MLDSKYHDSRSTQLVVLLTLITLPTSMYLLVNGLSFLILIWNWLRFERDDRIFLNPTLCLSWILLMGFLFVSYVSGAEVGQSDLTTFLLESLFLITIPPLFALNRGHLFWEKITNRSTLVNGFLLAWVIIALGGKLSGIIPGAVPKLPTSELQLILFTLFPFSMAILSADPHKPRRWNYFYLIGLGLILVAEPALMLIVTLVWLANSWFYFSGWPRLKILMVGSLGLFTWFLMRLLSPKVFGPASMESDVFQEIAASFDFYLNLIRERPFTGFGPRLSSDFLELRILDEQRALTAASSFNSYLSITVQSGLLGLGLFAMWLFTVCLVVWREAKSDFMRRSYIQAIFALAACAIINDVWAHPEARQIIMIALSWLFSTTTRLGEKTDNALPVT